MYNNLQKLTKWYQNIPLHQSFIAVLISVSERRINIYRLVYINRLVRPSAFEITVVTRAY